MGSFKVEPGTSDGYLGGELDKNDQAVAAEQNTFCTSLDSRQSCLICFAGQAIFIYSKCLSTVRKLTLKEDYVQKGRTVSVDDISKLSYRL